jgi:hypothetical protein
MNNYLVGFDIRLSAEQYVELWWDQKHRDEYLLRPDTPWPLSVDGLVWPSMFRVAKLDSLPDLAPYVIDLAPGRFPDFADLEQLKKIREMSGKSGGIILAIELFTEKVPEGEHITYERAGITYGFETPATNPAFLPRLTEFLGFDVADAGHISGLSNCGYKQEEKDRLAEQWGKRLNKHGLLPSLGDAVEFREMTNARVPEHAPFWIFGMHRLAE